MHSCSCPMSATFDIIDHNILPSQLRSHFQITGNALNWFASYVSDRSQMVKVGQYSSQPVKLKYGVPPGSVLSLILFMMNTSKRHYSEAAMLMTYSYISLSVQALISIMFVVGLKNVSVTS